MGEWRIKEVMNNVNDRIHNKLRLVGEYVEGAAKLLAPVDTGNLRNSINYKVVGDSVFIGTNVEYAPILEFGGVITPTQAKMLAIPLNKEAKKIYGMTNQTLHEVPELFVMKADGKLFLARDNGKDIEFLFILKGSVTREAKPFLRPALKNSKTAIRKIMEL